VPRPRRAQPSLVALLLTLVALELLVRRILGPLLHIDLLAPAGRARDFADVAGFFFYQAATVLGILLATLGLGRLLIFPSYIPRGAKVGVAVLTVAYVPLLILGTWRPLPGPLEAYLQASFTVLVLLLVLAGLLAPGRHGRARLGLVVVAVPLVLRLAATLGLRLTQSTAGTPALLFWIGEVCAVAAGGLMLPCFAPPRLRLGAAPVIALVAAVAAGVVAIENWEMAARVAAYGFGLQLPASKVGVALYALALGVWLLTTLSLIGRPGTLRLRGIGLGLVGLSGFQLEQPFQLAATLVGVLCLVESITRQSPRTTGEGWRALIRQIAAAIGAREVEVAGDEGYETARVRVRRTAGELEAEVEVAFGRSGGELSHAEVVIGHAPSEEAPPVALTRRGTPKLGRTRGEEVATGDLDFDEAFRIYDARHLTDRDRVLDDDLRPRLIEALDGWLAVWPGAGVRYRTRNAGVVDGNLNGLIDLLLDLKNRS
jgi:hypothetical protein